MKPIDTTLLWLETILFGLILYVCSFLYISAFHAQLTIVSMSEALGFTGGILIGLSFALSGLGYFFNIFDSKLKFRKMLGICGYIAALFYSLTLVLRFPERYVTNLQTSLLEVDVILGISAMGILTFMALISNATAIKFFGKRWRALLRLGYIAYLFLILRACIVEGEEWIAWFESGRILPPARLVLTLFALLTIVLRITLEIALRQKKKPISSSPSENSISPQPQISEIKNEAITN